MRAPLDPRWLVTGVVAGVCLGLSIAQTIYVVTQPPALAPPQERVTVQKEMTESEMQAYTTTYEPGGTIRQSCMTC